MMYGTITEMSPGVNVRPTSTRYRHRQPGRVILWCLGVATAFVAILQAARSDSTLSPLVVILPVVMLLFGWLTVEVSDDRVRWWFGPGLIWRRVRVADIRSVAAVRNRWYYGWGLRLTPHGWLYNVSGLDAVELELTNGRRVRVGTDQPRELVRAIESVTRRR